MVLRVSFPRKESALYERIRSGGGDAGKKLSAFVRQVLRAGFEAMDNPKPAPKLSVPSDPGQEPDWKTRTLDWDEWTADDGV